MLVWAMWPRVCLVAARAKIPGSNKLAWYHSTQYLTAWAELIAYFKFFNVTGVVNNIDLCFVFFINISII